MDRKTLPKTCIPESKLVIVANGSGWMNHETLEIWLKKVWKSRITLPPKTPWNHGPKVPSLLIFDMHRSHLVTTTLDTIKKESKVAIIPAGLTSKVQPLDLTVNHSFKVWRRIVNLVNSAIVPETCRLDTVQQYSTTNSTTI